MVEIDAVTIEKPEDVNFILGQAHFAPKSIEDLHEAMVNAVPGIKFGIAFCEASGMALIRWSGNDEEMTDLAKKNAKRIASGHSFIIFLKDAYPLNVLNALKDLNLVCNIFCATGNPTDVVVAENKDGRGILGVIDGNRSSRLENEQEQEERKQFLRKIGYKF
jgi:adenosine/AMP kinase